MRGGSRVRKGVLSVCLRVLSGDVKVCFRVGDCLGVSTLFI